MSALARLHALAFKAQETLTISTGVVTVTQGYHVIAAESGTNDDLDTITLGYTTITVNGIDYRPTIRIVADSGDTITLKDSTGNLDIGADIDLTGSSYIDLQWDGAMWIVALGASSGGSVTTFSDADFSIFNEADNTKTVKFDASGITTATERNFAFPDNDGTIIIDNGDQTFNDSINVNGGTTTLKRTNTQDVRFISGGTNGLGWRWISEINDNTPLPIVLQYATNDFSSGFVNAITVQPTGDMNISGTLSKGGGSFLIDHPLDATKDLYHYFVESPKSQNIYTGIATMIDGVLSVDIDKDHNMTQGTFEALNTDYKTFLFPKASVSFDGGVMTVTTPTMGDDGEYCYLVSATRDDEFWNSEDRPVEQLKPMPATKRHNVINIDNETIPTVEEI